MAFFVYKDTFFWKEHQNLRHLVDVRFKIAGLFFSFLGGVAYAASLPPLNLNIFAFFSLMPVFLTIIYLGANLRFAALVGWFWGLGWSFFSYHFLYEIEPVIPYLLAPVLAIWPAIFAAFIPKMWNFLIYSHHQRMSTVDNRMNYLLTIQAVPKIILFIFSSACLYTFIEWTRSRLFVWNDLSVTQWNNLPLVQLASITGSYGITFIIVLTNAFVVFIIPRRWYLIFMPLVILIGLTIWGQNRINTLDCEKNFSDYIWRPALIQANLFHPRNATSIQVTEALQIYKELSENAGRHSPKPDIIIWPESSISLCFYSPYPTWALAEFYGTSHPLITYRELVENLCSSEKSVKTPLLIGVLDVEKPVLPGKNFNFTNSALLFNTKGQLVRKYNKIHRVPFGEYIPFRQFLPQSLIKFIDMGRDLTPGNDYSPIQINKYVRAGVAICYEGVFAYITRSFAQNDANVLVVLSNDGWYPQSCEPEQHHANAVIRSVETGLYMVRCSNNAGSGVITPTGRFIQGVGKEQRSVFYQGRDYGIIEVPISNKNVKTFYVNYGEWFILVIGLWLSVVVIYLLHEDWKHIKLIDNIIMHSYPKNPKK